MPLYTCSRCHYTFPSIDKPGVCPDCGHKLIVPASDFEFNRFYAEKLDLLHAEHAGTMTTDERNWCRVLLLLNVPKASFYTAFFIRQHILEGDASHALDMYKGYRWEFKRRIKDDRIALHLEGYAFMAMILLFSNLSAYGAEIREQTNEFQPIEDMILYYGCYGGATTEEIGDLLAALKRVNIRKGKLWESIMDYWEYVNTGLVINTEGLPESLPKDDSLALILLGGALNANGSMKDELIARLQVGLDCAKQYPNALIVCTGGGTAKENKDVTEAGQMGAWLIENGLAEDRLVLEDQSRSTIENAQYTLNILCREHPRICSVAIISSDYHIARSSLLFETTMLMQMDENKKLNIHVLSNCASAAPDKNYTEEYLRGWQMYNMLQMIGDWDLARQYVQDPANFPRPTLYERSEVSEAA